MPKVSVIIPNYNHARFLSKRIESVLNQTFRDFEIIFLDDASTDESLDVFKRYEDNSLIRSIFNETNSGSPFKQWAKGLSEAKGEYVWIAESDDFADIRFLEKLTKLLDLHAHVGLAYSQSCIVNNEDQVMHENRRWTNDLDAERWSKNYINYGREEIKRFLIHKNTIPNASAVLFRREIALSNNAINENLYYCGDWFCWMSILLNSDIAYISESLNYWRQTHAKSVRGTVRSRQRIQEILYFLSFVSEKIDLEPGLLRNVSRKRYREWLKMALVDNIPWSIHRQVVSDFGKFWPNIRSIDAIFAPFFFARRILGARK